MRLPRPLPRGPASLAALLAIGVLFAAPVMAQERAPAKAQEQSEDPDEQPPPDDEQESGENERPDQTPDAASDPILDRVLKGIVLIDRPRFSAETHGKLQVLEPDQPRFCPVFASFRGMCGVTTRVTLQA